SGEGSGERSDRDGVNGEQSEPSPDSSSSRGVAILNEAIGRYEAGQFEQALVTFRELLSQDAYESIHGDAYFWIARSAIALGRLDEAADNLEYFLANYPENPYYTEGVYENGRLLHLQGDYEQSIMALRSFIEQYPKSPFVANAYYWMGESLFSLGHFDRAEQAFRTVTEQYSRSYRSEPAKYRLSIIDLRRREEELLKLLQWSHEEYVKAVDEFQEREQSFEAAIADYQRQIAENRQLSLQSEVQRLTREVATLRQDLSSRDSRIDDLTSEIQELRGQLEAAREQAQERTESAQEEPGESAEDREDVPSVGETTRSLVAAKSRALELKEFFLDELLRAREEER
ncbi:MAG: tetratricopeptide repeat protein, partial [Spirochaetaceae bacterium]